MNALEIIQNSLNNAAGVYERSLSRSGEELAAEMAKPEPDWETVEALRESMSYDRTVLHGIRISSTVAYNALLEAKERACEPV